MTGTQEATAGVRENWRRRLRRTLEYRTHRLLLAFPALTRPSRQHAVGSTIDGPIIISLTSYPARFPSLHITLRSLLAQSLSAERILLWIAREDIAQLPPSVRALVTFGVDIRVVDDLRSYKKLIFALEQFPDAYLAIADDDVIYGYRWLETLVRGFAADPCHLPCHRAHRITRDEAGAIAPYDSWEWDIQDGTPSTTVIPTGIGGVLYPPRSLSPETLNRQLFQELAPDADDLWFYWMARRQGWTFRKVGPRFPMLDHPGSQESALFADNIQSNDRHVRALCERFGRVDLPDGQGSVNMTGS